MSALIAILWLAQTSNQASNTAVDQITSPLHSTVTPQVGMSVHTIPPAISAPKITSSNQLSHNRPSTRPPASGSTRKQGRDTHTEALQGTDICDPQTVQTDDVCKQVIESRADEFTPPQTAPLSAEQSLMISQQKADNGRDVASATRKLANGDIDDTNAGLALSAIGSNSLPTDDKSAKPESNSATDAIVSTVVGIFQGAAR